MVDMLDDTEVKKVVAEARYPHADPFDAHVVVDDRLVTGQNPASAAGVAAAMIRLLRAPTQGPHVRGRERPS